MPFLQAKPAGELAEVIQAQVMSFLMTGHMKPLTKSNYATRTYFEIGRK